MKQVTRPWGMYAVTALIAAGAGGLAGSHAPPVPAADAAAGILYLRQAPTVQNAQTKVPKIGFINTQFVFDQHPEVPRIRQAFQNQVQQWQKQQVDMEEQAQTLQNELRTAQLSPTQRRRKEAELAQVMQDLSKYQTTMWSQGGTAEQKEQEMMQPVIQAMDAVIKDIAEKDKYDLILDAAGGGLLFGHKDMDLTTRVLTSLGITPTTPPPGEGGPG